MKKLLLIVGAIVLLLVVAIVAIPFLIPVERYKQEISAQVKTATGRDLALNGPLKLSLFPSIVLKADDVHFSNVPGATEPDMARFETLKIAVKLMPLFAGKLQVDGFELVKPVIHLAIDKTGKGNWEFDVAPDQTKPETEAGNLDEVLQNLTLGLVKLSDGLVTYSDARDGTHQELSAINSSLDLPKYDGPLAVKGDFVWNKEKIDLALTAANLKKLMEGQQENFTAKVSAAPVNFSVDGQGRMAEKFALIGKATLDVPSLRKLAAWTGNPLEAPGSGFGPLKLSGDLDLANDAYAFKNATIQFDKINATGALTVKTGGERLALSGNLTADALDLNPYLPPEEPESKWAGWSEEPIDVSGLKAADADFAFKTKSLTYRKIQIGQSSLHLDLKAGILNANLQEMALYGGSGKGSVTVNGSGTTPSISANFQLSKVNAEPLLKDAGDFDKLSGTLTTNLAVTTSGKHQKAMISALNGNGSFAFADGSLKGVDIAAVATSIEKVVNGFKGGGTGLLTGLTSGDLTGSIKGIASMFGGAGEVNQSTKFSSLKGTWSSANGTVSQPDLQLIGPYVNNRTLLKMTGHGQIMLPPQTLDYEATVHSFAKATVDNTGIGGTVRLSGPLSDPYPCVVLGSLCLGKKTSAGDLLKSGAADQLKSLIPGKTDGVGSSLKDKLKGFKFP
ncbi:AsmA family protein [Govanella unica]|uniref:AsmA family protein n=1 Tax=Govanella unica TaxID=2975056 RepID=A0A9X3TZB2_9PROT|nr:AsmA family protein [Govania unica]MDA5194720.1 AsmA family protein [Govania unica]